MKPGGGVVIAIVDVVEGSVDEVALSPDFPHAPETQATLSRQALRTRARAIRIGKRPTIASQGPRPPCAEADRSRTPCQCRDDRRTLRYETTTDFCVLAVRPVAS